MLKRLRRATSQARRCQSVSASDATAPNSWSSFTATAAGSGGAVALSVVLREPWLRTCLSVWDAGGVVVRALAGLPQRNVSVPGAALVLTAVLLWTWWRARARLRLAEAIA